MTATDKEEKSENRQIVRAIKQVRIPMLKYNEKNLNHVIAFVEAIVGSFKMEKKLENDACFDNWNICSNVNNAITKPINRAD
jgi:hypothetical protein